MDIKKLFDNIDKFTNDQATYLQICIMQGKPWSLFAESVFNQGWCSNKQEQALKNMAIRIEEINRKRESYHKTALPGQGEWDYINDEWQPEYH